MSLFNEVDEMAKKIELGLELHGEDAEEFFKELKSPNHGPRAKQVIARAKELCAAREKK